MLVMYSKPGCCLCDGLKEKLDVILASLPVQGLEVRDINTDPEWTRLYAMEIPVLTVMRGGGDELPIRRPPPRMAAERLGVQLGNEICGLLGLAGGEGEGAYTVIRE